MQSTLSAIGLSSVRLIRLACLFCLTLGGCDSASVSPNAFPQKPIKVIVPFGAGGGSDTFTRILQKAITEQELLDQPIVVINMPGAGGSIGSRKVKNSRPDGYTLLQIHEGMITNKHSGNANFGPESFVPIAGTGQMAHVIAVPSNSPYQNLSDLLNAATAKPDSIVFAVGIGAPSHFAGLMLEKASINSAAKFRFTQSGGGAKRFASLLGGHSSVSTFSVAEFVEFQASGLRALAILSEERHGQAPDVPTAMEQGVRVNSTNMHFWWAPKGTPEDRIEKIANVLQTAMELPQVKTVLRGLATDPEFVRGEALLTELHKRELDISSVTQRSTTDLPDFGMIIFALCCLTGAAVLVQRILHRPAGGTTEFTSSVDVRSQVVVSAVAVAYVAVLQFFRIDYRLATGVFVLLVGGYVTRNQRKHWPAVGATAVVLSVGLHLLFTRVLVVDLP